MPAHNEISSEKMNAKGTTRKEAGFTLIEFLVVIAIGSHDDTGLSIHGRPFAILAAHTATTGFLIESNLRIVINLLP
jgi:prepilin-type N-terminal cleavage/methylation domain-containing protein